MSGINRRPTIGVLGEVDDGCAARIRHAYVKSIEKSGGVPVVIPYSGSEEALRAAISLCDGVLFSGGVDIDPERYGEMKTEACGEVQPLRDELELTAFRLIKEAKKPALAICRGMQLVNVALGGTLYQDLPTQKPSAVLHNQAEPKDAPSHSVRIYKDTPLYEIINKTEMRANSFHHQAIKALAPSLSVMAEAEDGAIEAVFYDGDWWLRAYQWHPERLSDIDEGNAEIFTDFINACKNRIITAEE